MRFRPRTRSALTRLSFLVLLLTASIGAAASGIGASSGTLAAPAPAWAFSPLNQLGADGAQRTTAPVLLHFNGNPPEDADCTGTGTADVAFTNCSDLRQTAVLSAQTAARWIPVAALNQPALDRSNVDPNWIWLSGATTIEGDMSISFWAQVNTTAVLIGMAWRIQVFADAVQVFTTTGDGIPVTYAAEAVPELKTVTVTLPEITATQTIVIKVDPQFADTGAASTIFYDSSAPCPNAAAGSGACDSTVTMPVTSSTATRMVSFGARASSRGVLLTWRTGAESSLLGFEVWRGRAGAERRVNRELIRATGRAGGATYRFLDRGARKGTSYTYRLRLVRSDGSRTWYGAARAGARR